MEIKGIKKAVGDYKRYNSRGRYSPHYGYLMFNNETCELWTDYYYSLGHNSWRQYDNPNIINLGFKMELEQIKVNMKNVKAFITGGKINE